MNFKKSRKQKFQNEMINIDDELNIRRSFRFVEEIEDHFAKYNNNTSNTTKNLYQEVFYILKI